MESQALSQFESGSVAALIVAGGHGDRMRESGSPVPKPLVRIRGVTLLERNLISVLRAGIMDVHVAVSGRPDGVGDFAHARGRALAEALGGSLSVITERRPLGSIGAAASLADYGCVVVVNSDNLTSMDLRDILVSHTRSSAALTLAVHDQPFPIPFGEIVADGERVVEYKEKPTLTVRVCSAISVLGAQALAMLIPGEAIGLPAFANRLLVGGATVRSFFHDAPWIDVNDLAAARRAEALVGDHSDQFELMTPNPDEELVAFLSQSDRGLALERSVEGAWRLPCVEVPTGGGLPDASSFASSFASGTCDVDAHWLTTFDHVDTARRRVVRVHVMAADGAEDVLGSEIRWVPLGEVSALENLSSIIPRAVAAVLP